MEVGPIVRSLRRNKTRFLLIVLQIAITLAVVANGISMMASEEAKLSKKSGFDDDNIIWVYTRPYAPAFQDKAYARHEVDADLRVLQALPNVQAVSNTTFLPWIGGGSSDQFRAAGGDGTKFLTQSYFTTPGILDTLGIHLVAGRDLRLSDMHEDGSSNTVLMSKAAEKLYFKGQSAVGKQMIESDNSVDNIVGVFDPFYNPYGWPIHEYSVFFAGRSPGGGASYLVHVRPGTMPQVAPVLEKTLLARNDGRNIQIKTIDEIKDTFFTQNRIVIGSMAGVILLIMVVTGLGIAGVTSFTVTERKKQIGTRRALGATQRDILRYFLLENSIVTNSGLILGIIAAYTLNYVLVTQTSAAKLDWEVVAAGVILLWVQGVTATFLPALRAARLSPVIATRGV